MNPRSTSSRLKLSAAFALVLFVQCPSWAQVAVNAGGTPSFSHAIKVPPGVRGLAPQIAVTYGGSDGVLGAGWALSGISVIARCPASKVLDGKPAGVSFTAADKLCIDGQRLIPTDGAGANPLVGANTNDALGLATGSYREYRTELRGYARIRAYGTAYGSNTASGPAFFKVWTKEGLIFEYGNGPSSDANTNATLVHPLLAGQSYPPVGTWAVSRVSDIYGNHVDFKYSQRFTNFGSVVNGSNAGLDWVLKEIQYSGNKVVFNYVDRSVAAGVRQSVSESYLGSAKSVRMRLLDSVSTYVNSPNVGSLGPSLASPVAVPVATTRFTHSTSAATGRSLLAGIATCAGVSTTQCVPAAAFTYTPGGGDVYVQNTAFNAGGLWNGSSPPTAGTLVIDANGDGKADFLAWDAYTPTGNYLLLSNGDGSFTQVPAGTGPGKFNLTSDILNSGDDCIVSILGDYDGDGLTDILRYGSPDGTHIRYTPLGNTCPIRPTLLLRSNGDGSFTRTVVSLPAGVTLRISGAAGTNVNPSGQTWTQGENFHLLDVDGDGKLDIVTSKLPAVAYWDYSNDAGNPNPCASITCTRVFKGDGGGAFATELTTNMAHVSLANGFDNARGPRTYDIDNDGLADLFLTNDVRGGIPPQIVPYAVRSRGDGNFDILTNPQVCNDPFVGVAPPILACRAVGLDYNGDGVLDRLVTGETAAKNRLFSSPVGIVAAYPVSNFNLTAGTNLLKPEKLGRNYAAIDVNGDGRDDILRWNAKDATETALYLSNGDGTFMESSTFTFKGAALQTYFEYLDEGTTVRELTSNFLTGDFTGHGNVEFVRFSSQSSPQLWVKANQLPPDLLATVTGPTGLLSTLSYMPAGNPVVANNAGNPGASLGPRYTSDRGTSNAASGTLIDALPGWLVTTLTNDNGVGGTRAEEYAYFGFKRDRSGQLGPTMRESRRQGPGANGAPLTNVTTFVLTAPYGGAVASDSRHAGALNAVSASNRLEQTTNLYCDQGATPTQVNSALASGVHCPVSAILKRPYKLLATRTATDLAGAALPTTSEQTAINTDGEPTLVVEKSTMTNAASDTYTTTTTTTYGLANDTSCSNTLTCKWILSRPTQVTVNKVVPSTILATSPGSGPASIAVLTSAASATLTSWYGDAVKTAAFSYRNDGNVAMTLVSPSLAAPLSMQSNGCSAVAPGNACSIVVAFTATAVQPGGTASQSFTPSGATVAPAGVTVTWTLNSAVPRWGVGSLALGSVTVGQSSSANITLFNAGSASYNWAANNGVANLPAGFSMNTSACSAVAAGGSCNVVVTFTPTIGGSYSGSGINLTSRSYSALTNYATFAVSGTGVQPYTNPTIAGVSQGGTTSTIVATLTLTNIAGNGSITTGTPTVAKTGTGGTFSVTGGTCTNGAVVAAPGTCTVQVTVTGVTATCPAYTGTVTVPITGHSSVTGNLEVYRTNLPPC